MHLGFHIMSAYVYHH